MVYAFWSLKIITFKIAQKGHGVNITHFITGYFLTFRWPEAERTYPQPHQEELAIWEQTPLVTQADYVQ